MLLLGWYAILFFIVYGSGLQGMQLVVTKWRCQFRTVSGIEPGRLCANRARAVGVHSP